jgi:KDO2-lipid IV(A) lauroyltransferase
MFFELLTLGKPSWRRIERMVEFEGLENYCRAREAGRGVLLVAAHFGNWEIHALAHGYRLGPMTVVARLQGNPHYNRRLEEIRTASGNSVLYKERALAGMLRLLKDGGTVAILIDQNVAREDGIFVEYFGHLAAATPVASWLAVKTGAALVPVFTLPLADGRYRLIYEEPIDAGQYSGPDRRQTVQELTQQCSRVLEGHVRRNPEYWLWMHRRWKTRPAGEAMDAAALRTGEVS